MENFRRYCCPQTKSFLLATVKGLGKGRVQKIKMEILDGFAMKGGVSRVPTTYSEKECFLKPYRIIPWLLKRVLHLVWDLYYVYIVVEVTLNMAK